MTETVAYIKNSIKDFYPPGETQALVRLIMERVCGLSTYQLLLGKGTDLSDTEKSKIKEIVEGLRQYKPIQYLLGIADFHGLEFKVTPSVLIPRPETAELVDLIISDYKNLSPSLLDIGTGSGCIAISLAKSLPNATVSAIDISPEALAVAKENAATNEVNVDFHEMDILANRNAIFPFSDLNGTTEPLFDCIVSNPPYIMDKEKAAMDPNVLENEPHLALFVPDNDPLRFYRAIAQFGKRNLKEGGHLYFEINALCGNETIEMLREEGYNHIELIRDLYGKDRMTKAIL